MEPAQRLILILSSERSGSTLLRVMLGAHSRVISPSELWLLQFEEYDEWRCQKPAAINSVVEYLSLVGCAVTPEQLDINWSGRRMEDLYGWMLTCLPSHGVLVDKTPGYANSPATLQRSQVFSPFYIWLVRHPLGVVDSQVRLRGQRNGTWRPGHVKFRLVQYLERISRHGMTRLVRRHEAKWLAQNHNIRIFLAGVPPAQHSIVRFEDLVTRPAETLNELCAALRLAFQEAMADPPCVGTRMRPGLGDPNFHTRHGIEADTAYTWMHRYSQRWLAPDTLEMVRALSLDASSSRAS